MLLAGDIGGTKTRLALFDSDACPRTPLKESTFQNNHYDDLESIITTFLSGNKDTISHATFGVAGPIHNGNSFITNLPWIINASSLSNMLLGANVILLNDLEATALSISHLKTDELATIKAGINKAKHTIALIAPGTGLGEAYLTWDGTSYVAHASEGSHVEFGPRNDLEIKLLQYMIQKTGHVSYEKVCSGLGIRHIYDFFKTTENMEEPEWLSKELQSQEDPTPTIIATALQSQNDTDICRMTLNMMISILGAETGNLALKFIPEGGIYIGGGIPPRILNELKSDRFINAFIDKGRVKPVLKDIPIQVILNPDAALLGASVHVFNQHNHN